MSRSAADEPAEFRGIHHVQLAVPVGLEDRCRAFWVEAVGLVEIEKPPVLAARGGCWFRGGGLEIHLGLDPDFRPATKAHPGILVSGLRSLAARLEASGVALTWDEAIPGLERFYVSDPVGNRLEFVDDGGSLQRRK